MTHSPQIITLNLWENIQASASQEIEFQNPDVDHRRFLRNVSVPTLTAFLPPRSINTGTSVIVCPGGGFHILAIDYEGLDVARWLCERGITAFVLKYRLLPTPIAHDDYQVYFNGLLEDLPRLSKLAQQHTPTMLADAQQALRIVRQRASEWNVAPERVGMIGFSAGAYVTVRTILDSDSETRPNFGGSIYGGLWGSLDAPAPLPPLFIALTDDDTLVVPENSLQLFSAWHHAGSPVEMHVYAHGGHGFAMRNVNLAAEGWIQRFYDWMQVDGLTKR